MKREKLPRKMKKRFKKMMLFFEERKNEYTLKKVSDFFVGALVLQKLKEMGIKPEDVCFLKYENGQLNVRLNQSIEKMEIKLTV